MSKELEKDFMNDIMDKVELKVEPTDIAKLLYDIYDVPGGICEQIKDMVQRLEAIEKGECTDITYNVMAFKNDNANPSEALKELTRIENNITYLLSECDINEEVSINFNSIVEHKSCDIIKQAILKAQELKSENDALLEENKDLYVELAFGEKQYKELIECNKQYGNVLKIIFEKEVNLGMLKTCKSIEQYNAGCRIFGRNELTQEEFDLLKSWLDNKKEQ